MFSPLAHVSDRWIACVPDRLQFELHVQTDQGLRTS